MRPFAQAGIVPLLYEGSLENRLIVLGNLLLTGSQQILVPGTRADKIASNVDSLDAPAFFVHGFELVR